MESLCLFIISISPLLGSSDWFLMLWVKEKVLSETSSATACTKPCIKRCQKPEMAEINEVQKKKLFKDMELLSPYAGDTLAGAPRTSESQKCCALGKFSWLQKTDHHYYRIPAADTNSFVPFISSCVHHRFLIWQNNLIFRVSKKS